MINHLKSIHRLLYLPAAPESEEPPFKVTPINDPYLYTDANICVEAFDNPNQTVKVAVSNVGGGTLQVARIRIPRVCGKWIKQGKRSTPAALTTTAKPLDLELQLILKALPNSSVKNAAELNILSNSRRKTFSKVSLQVCPSEEDHINLSVPEHINFGEITVWNVSIIDKRKGKTTDPVDFFLVGNFRINPPTRLKITQKDDFSFDAKFLLQESELYYGLDLRTPGVVMPQQKKAGLKLKSFQQAAPIANVNRHKFSGAVKSDAEWLTSPNEINIDGYETINLPVSVKVEKLKPGCNFGELVISDKRIPIWAWYKTFSETVLTLNPNQPTHYTVEFPNQGKRLPIEIVKENEPYQSAMIFQDVNFRFPLTEENETGYLIGDFNQWTQRTLLLDKWDDNFFSTTLSLSDGTYLFRAEIDGEMRLDPNRLHEIVCGSHGLASRIEIKRDEQKLKLHNRSRQRLTLRLQSPTEWIEVDNKPVTLSANGHQNIPLVLLPRHLKPGLNLGWVEIETIGKLKRALQIPIFFIGMTHGAVPILQNPEIEFPIFEQGKPENISLGLDIFGKGELKGEIQPSTILHLTEGDLRIQNETAFESIEITTQMQVRSNKPSNAYRKRCDAWLVTDCYIANRRLLPFTVRYNMIHLISNPSSVYFPKVFLFHEPQHTIVTVQRSDGKAVACSAEIPEELTQSGFLSVKEKTYKGEMNQCEFVLNPKAVTDTGHFTGNIQIKDKKSKMTLPIRFGANIIGSRSNIQIENSTQSSRRLDEIPVVITNVGETEMKIFEVRFKTGNLYYTPHLTPNLTLLPSESLTFHVKARRRVGFFRKIEDTLIIRLNDPQFPQGTFEKKITAKIHGIF